MRYKRHLVQRDYKISQPGRGRSSRGLRKIVLAVLLLGGGGLIFSRLLALPTETPTVTRYEVIPIQQ